VHVELGVGVGVDLRGERGAADPGVHVALPRPDVHVRPAGDPPDVRAEELVGQEQHLAVGRDDSTTSTALEEVQQTSVSAFTAAVVLT
jgi:hypothetical protein